MCASECPVSSGIGLNKVRTSNVLVKNQGQTNEDGNENERLNSDGSRNIAGAVASGGAASAAGGRTNLGCGGSALAQPAFRAVAASSALGCGNFSSQPQQPALFAWVMGGGKNLTPVRRCCLGGPHPGTSRSWRQLCQRIGHCGISKHAEMAAIAALHPDTLWASRRQRLTLVVVRLRAASRATGSQATASSDQAALSQGDSAAEESEMELGLARPCDECAKVICALGCFRRIVYSTADGCLTSIGPEELLQQCTPSSGKRQQRRERLRLGEHSVPAATGPAPHGARHSRSGRRGH